MTGLLHNGQLSLDFNLNLTKDKPSENKGSFSYHPSDSTILKDSFSLKVSYLGRSYILKGKYRIATIRAFGDMEDRLNTLGFVELDKIMTFKGFMYSPAFVTRQEKLKLSKVAEKILANPAHNENLST